MGWKRYGYTSEGYTSCGTKLFYSVLGLVIGLALIGGLLGGVAAIVSAAQP